MPLICLNRWDCSWWRHQMETFSALLALCAGNSPVPVNSPHKGQWRGALMFSLFYAWINDWVNNREAGDLRRQCGYHDVIVMFQVSTVQNNPVYVCSSAFPEPDMADCNCPSDCSTTSYTIDFTHAALPSLSVDRSLTSNVNSPQKHYHRALGLKYVSCADI